MHTLRNINGDWVVGYFQADEGGEHLWKPVAVFDEAWLAVRAVNFLNGGETKDEVIASIAVALID